jgi:large repetitive protein
MMPALMTGRTRYLGAPAGLAIIFVALLSLLGGASARAAETCSSTALYVAAHQDDTLLFQSPALLQDVQSGHCVRTVFLTAGDDGREQPYWVGREDGAQAAYAQMAGVANQWTASTTTVAGRQLHVATLNGKPSISLYYLRLPDGGIEGEGSMLYGFKSLMKLWNSGQPGSTSPPQDATIEAVDHSATYTYSGLIETLKGLMTQLEPQQILTQNYIVAIKGPDHADHAVTARFARAASQAYPTAHRLVGYRDYEVTSQPENVFGTMLGAKAMAFYTYGQHDSGACASEPACAGSAYAEWLRRQYTVASETTGVVANAGYNQTTTPGVAVTLDGSGSSHAGSGTLNYAWTQIGGPTVALGGATTAAPSLTTPSHPTVLTFSLTVSDKTGSSRADTVVVRVPATDPTPTAIAGPEQQVGSAATVSLDGSESWDPNSLALQYAWIQTGGPAVTLNNSSSAKPSFTAPTGPTTLTFTLVVSNGTQTSAPVTTKVKVAGIVPSFGSAATTTLTTGVAGSFKVEVAGSPTATIARTGTLPGGLGYADNGDGTATISGTPAASAAEPAQTASYPLTLTATNSEGKATQSFVLKVQNPGTPPSFKTGTTASFTAEVAGSFTVGTDGAPTAAVKQISGTLPAGLTFADQGDGTAKISGTPTAAAAAPGKTQEYPVSLKAESAAGSSTQTLTLKVTNPGAAPAITSGTAAGFTTGVVGSFTITSTGAPNAALTRTGTLPAGITFSDNGDGTAKVSGTPTGAAAPAGESREYPLTIKADNGVGSSATQSLTLTVTNPGTPPSFTSGSSSTFTTGVAKTFTVSAGGAPTPALAVTGTLPEGLSFHDNGDGSVTLSGTAADAAAPPNGTKPYGLSFEATSKAGSKTQSFTLTVSNPGSAPVFKSGTSASFTTEVAGSFTVETTAAPKAALTKTAGELPPGMSFADNGDGSGKISGTPTAAAAAPGASKNYSVTLRASNGVANVTQTLTLKVTNPGAGAQISSVDHAEFSTGVAGSFTVTSTGLPAATLTRTGALPPGMSFADQGDGSAKISGTPTNAAAPPAQTQSYPITVEADNGVGQAVQTLTLKVTNPGSAPSFSSAETASFTTGAAGSFIVSTGAAPTAGLTITVGDLPAGLSFLDRGDGTAKISGTPTNAAAPPAQTQNYPVTVKAQNAVGSQTQTLTIKVTNPGSAPSFTSGATAAFTTGAVGNFAISTSAAPNAALSITAGTLPAGLSFIDNGDGSAKISGTPTNAAAPPAQTQSYPVTVKAQNAVGSQTQTLTIKVTNPGSAPSFTSGATAAFTTGAVGNFAISTNAAPNAALAITAGTLPAGLAFTDNGDGSAKVSGTATNAAAPPAQTQSYPVTVKAQNAVGSQTQVLTIKVTNPGSAPSFSSGTTAAFTTGAAGNFAISTSAAPNAALSVTAGTLPAGLAFTDNGDGSAKVSGTASDAAAPPAQTQSYPVTVKAQNAVGHQTQTLTIEVTNPGTAAAFTSGNATTFTTGVAESFTVTTSGAPGAAITKASGQLPSGVTLVDNGDGTATLAGTPARAAAPDGGSQPYAFSFQATNGVGSPAGQSFTLTVFNPGDAPFVTSAGTTGFTTGVAGSFTVTANGSPKPALSKGGDLPAGLSFVDNGDGTATISGTPEAAAAPAAGSRDYDLTIAADSSVGHNSKGLKITVTNPGAAPQIISGGSAQFTTGVAGSFTVASSGDPVATLAADGMLPAGLSFHDNGDGTATISGTPAVTAAPAGGSRDYALSLAATSAAGDAGKALTITVSRPADPAPEEAQKPAAEPAKSDPPKDNGNSTGGDGAQAEPPLASQVDLAQPKLALPIGKPSRRVVAVEAPADATVSCAGKLPKGLRCKVNKAGDVVIEVTKAATVPGTYKVAVKVARGGSTIMRTLRVKLS